MSKTRVWLCCSILSLSFQTLYADDTATAALEKTRQCLSHQNCDSATTAEGKAADQKALEAVGGDAARKQELYDISADIMPFLMQQTGGDMSKLEAIMKKAQTDPEGFYKSLPPEVQAKIRNTASVVEKKTIPTPNR